MKFLTFNALQVFSDPKNWVLSVVQFEFLTEGKRFYSGSLFEIGIMDGVPAFDILYLGLTRKMLWPF